MKRWMPFLLIICVVLLLPAVSVSARAADTSGTCGDNLTWTFEEETGTLTIEGTGPMWDWGQLEAPWQDYRYDLKSVVIDSGVTSIGDRAFSDCWLTQVTIPDSVTYIGDLAFYACWLTKVTISDSVTFIGDQAFASCSNLTSINVNANNEFYCSIDGILFDKHQTILIQYPAGKPDTVYTLPHSVTSIGDYAFYSCVLTRVTIPDSVTAIGDGAFYSCYRLTSVTIPNSVTSIGDEAFYSDALTAISVDENNAHYCSVDGVLFDKPQTTLIRYPARKQGNIYNIPESVTAIGNSAFSHCGSLTEVTIPDSVTSIGDYAFYRCTGLAQVTIPDGVTAIGERAFASCYDLAQVNIPDSVTSIGDLAFFSCESLTKVDIPNSVTTIKAQTFSWCTSLTQVTIPDSVTTIEDYAFYNCTGLTQVTIPNSVSSIVRGAFSGCSSLTQVTIPNSVIFIGEWAFYNSDSLTDVFYIGTEAQWDAITVNVGNDPLLNATIHYAFDTTTGAVSIPALPEGAESALIAAYADGKLVCAVTGKVGNDNYIPLANQPDEIRIFYLGSKYQPVTAPDIIRLD